MSRTKASSVGRGGAASKPKAAALPRAATPAVLDKYSLYELCAQAPERDARLLRAIYDFGGAGRGGQTGARAQKKQASLVFGEDFAGTAALSRAWVRLFPKDSAVAVDHDAACIERAIRDAGGGKALTKITFHVDDVRRVRDKADLIAVQNFSIGELHERADLVNYLQHARSRLKPRGCFVCDIYDGADRFTTGVLDETIPGPGGESIYYEWEQREADPMTARVVNAMHFEVDVGFRSGGAGFGSRVKKKQTQKSNKNSSAGLKQVTARHSISTRNPDPETRNPTRLLLRDAFVYHWRLWSVPELRDAMHEAGFRQTLVFPRTPDAIDSDGNAYIEPVTDPVDLSDAFNVYVVGR